MSGEESKLLALFGRLSPEQQDRLIAFAEFLGHEPEKTQVPVRIPRPDGETVTMAIRRLVRAYPMLDRRRLMGEAARFMAEHALNDRPVDEVIDELEAVFVTHYKRMKDEG